MYGSTCQKKENGDRPKIDAHFPVDSERLAVQNAVPISFQNIGEGIQAEYKAQIFRKIVLAPDDRRNIEQKPYDGDQYFLQILENDGER